MDLSLWELLNGAGKAMWGILFFSVLCVTVAVERTLVLRRFLPEATKLTRKVVEVLAGGAYAEARSVCERSPSSLADVYLTGFEKKGRTSWGNVVSATHRQKTRLVHVLRNRVWLLGTVGALAPFVGLYGTVVGIMGAFSKFKDTAGEGGIASVSGDIGEALIVTAAGILVALGGVILYNYFNQRIGRISQELKMQTEEFLENLHDCDGEMLTKNTGKSSTKGQSDGDG